MKLFFNFKIKVSYALHRSSLDWSGPIGCVRVGMLDDKFICNPSRKQLEMSPINLVVSVASNKNIGKILISFKSKKNAF